MSLTLTDIKTKVSAHLNDTGKLIWSDALLEAAIRSSLLAIGRILDEPLTLEGLDGAAATSLVDDHQHVLVVGAVAYALTLRATGRFDDARAKEDLPDALAAWASAHMARFQVMLGEVKASSHQKAATVPYDHWDWEEDE